MRRHVARPSVEEHWMKAYWRPSMGWLYMLICACDFVIFPVFWGILQAANKVTPMVQWVPLTLQGAGLVHLAFGTILGIAAWGRSKEKTTLTEYGNIVTETETEMKGKE